MKEQRESKEKEIKRVKEEKRKKQEARNQQDKKIYDEKVKHFNAHQREMDRKAEAMLTFDAEQMRKYARDYPPVSSAEQVEEDRQLYMQRMEQINLAKQEELRKAVSPSSPTRLKDIID